MNHDHDLAGRTAYYTRCAVSTDDPDEAYFLQADYERTLDGGLTHETMEGARSPTWDTHEMWIDPADGDRMIVVGDGGLAITVNRGESWYRNQLPVAQLYHVRVDDRVPYWIYTNRQDGPSLRGPSDSRTAAGFFGGGIARGMWHTVGGGESGHQPRPIDLPLPAGVDRVLVAGNPAYLTDEERAELEAARAELLVRDGRSEEARDSYRRAIDWCRSPVERAYLRRRLAEQGRPDSGIGRSP